MNGILVIAHAPLASALRQCVLHVFPDAAPSVVAVDVLPQASPDESLQQARRAVTGMDMNHLLVLTDVFGATPCNVAQRLVEGAAARLVSGVSLPMLLRAVTYRHEPLDMLVSRAMAGGAQGIIPVSVTAPQNQNKRSHDQNHHDHQQ
ncbi:MAG: PTS fructose transporter subunit IIA [Burkholderiaceae bacterium]|jgi:PTS system ascorbate-specific IIA component|nr:PTS fructose transporter subunit IIA [Burkholderiaceae bacterium]MDP3423079.1 PTS fructose transporter subunit IIA [Burkholderiaceae bacterium]MDZ4162340.1 PTS fructose transporter subunit IIA [Burkholderiales bacterium]